MYNISDDGNFHAEEESNPIRTTATTNASQSTNMTPLPANFEPGPDDVICGRGKKCYNHVGNERFRLRVLTYLEEYSAAKSKLEKSGVLSKVVDAVRQQSPDGGFVKQDERGKWHEVGDFLAREKTSQSFRDALHDRYKSSNISKKKRRQDEQSKQAPSMMIPSRGIAVQQPRSDNEISSRLERLSNELLHSQQLHDIDYFTRRNSDVIAAVRGYDLQLQQAQPPQQRLQQADVQQQQFLDPNRRYSSGNIDFYNSSRERPFNEMPRLPDPLFGTARNTINATPSEFDRERLALAQQAFDRDRSISHSEPDYTRSDLIGHAPIDAKLFHSSIPEMIYPNMFEDFSLLQQSSIHQTFPDAALENRVQSESDRKRPAKVIEHVQYEQGSSPTRRFRKSVAPETFMKKVTSTPYAAATLNTTTHSDIQFPLSHHQQSAPRMFGGQKISRDLMDCLDKMTYHSIADDNPFEPIPLAPHQEAALSIKRRASDVVAAPATVASIDSYHQQAQHHPSIDESERDEFAEG